ncbi:hypothetical protein AX16_001070 [Volvariella volvacea WC 439]|nr:hypothetical protein AX16_001070 [Volvariella volvacea WC 439]
MLKRTRTPSVSSTLKGDVQKKRAKTNTAQFRPTKLASAKAAAAVDADPPLFKLIELLKDSSPATPRGECVAYWMRMADLRIYDNKALSMASMDAQQEGIPLVAFFVISPQDYIAHDRSARRIDFTLRNLTLLKSSLAKLNIPLHVMVHAPRRTIPSQIVSMLRSLDCTRLYANIEYEVDELRRDIQLCKLAQEQGLSVKLYHNKCMVEPGIITKKDGTAYAVYSPYQKNWIQTINQDLSKYTQEFRTPQPNSEDFKENVRFTAWFESEVPNSVEGFELDDVDQAKMSEIWPGGEDAAREILRRFLETKARTSQMGAISPLTPGAEAFPKRSRVSQYHQERDHVNKDTTSRLSVYLSSGVISVRDCIRSAMKVSGEQQAVDARGTTGIGRWVQELAWRDFYTSILACYPRLSMGRPYLEKFANVVWEDHQAPGDTRDDAGDRDGEMLRRWKAGMTGFPIVDATMRCIREMGWVHNRLRMITAMFLVKDLMIDWRVGERYFMQQLIDGDLASNNGGWQWCASTGVDPCPYFRIFNPYSQSGKADPTGAFIHHWVPELRKLRGKDLHKPSASAADKLGYPRPIVDHEGARDRALRRYKNPGEI